MADTGSKGAEAGAGQQNSTQDPQAAEKALSKASQSTPAAPRDDSARSSISTPATAVKTSFDSSRTGSPTRKGNATAPPNTLQSARARSAALSPTRAQVASAGASTPSAAAVQRALSAVNADQNRASPGLDGQTRLARTQADTTKASSPHLAPTRMKSPPPSSASSSRRSSVGSSKQPETSMASPSLTAVRRAQDVPEKTLSPTQAQHRIPRGTSAAGSRLETVTESSVSPQNRTKMSQDLPQATQANSSQTPSSETTRPSNESTKAAKTGQAEQKTALPDRAMTPQPQAPSRKPSTSSLVPNKTRAPAEGSKHMTVETETVSSIPQNVTNTDRMGSARSGGGGSLRARPSSDTIRPKKDRKKNAKRPPPIVAGPGSSKAELFEQRVASEIEGESTDSDETFVYESNPAESQARLRYHSRTPSSASLSGAPERNRQLGRVLTGGEFALDRPVRPKRSMKFASSSYAGSIIDDDSADTHQGTIRTHHNMRSTPRPDHKHVGRIHRDNGHASDSPLDSDSPFTQAQRMRNGTGSGWRSPRGTRESRSDASMHGRTPTKSNFDSFPTNFNASGTSDDERAPLLRALRNPRTRDPHHLRHTDLYESPERSSGWWSGLRAFFSVVGAFVVLAIVVGGLLLVVNKPLYEVSVMEIQNVLASEQEIMLDLLIQAINPNVAAITVNDMDVNVFAKSRYVSDPDHDPDGGNDTHDGAGGTASKSTKRRLSAHYRGSASSAYPHMPNPAGGVDDGTDPMPCPPWEPDCPMPDKDHDRQTMLLGRIFHFDSALSYDPSPLRRIATNSSGEMRLARPGNKTESGGSDRWERVIQHPFELIIRGILKYQLPLSTRVQTKSVGASVAVFPEEDIRGGSMRVVMLSRLESFERGGREVKMRGDRREDPDAEVGIPEKDEARTWNG